MIHVSRFTATIHTLLVPWFVAEACGATGPHTPAVAHTAAQRNESASTTRAMTQSNETRARLLDAAVPGREDPTRPTSFDDAGGVSTPEELPGSFTDIDGTPFLVGIAATASWSKRAYHVEPVGTARKLMFGPRDGDLIVIPFRLIYEGNRGNYCDIALFRSGAARPIGYPAGVAGNDLCASMRKVAEADVNHDEIPDFIFEVNVRSNRDESELVREGAVYISDRKRMTYCYAPRASDAVTGIAAYTPAAAVDVIEGRVEARGAEETFACGRDGL